MTTQFAKLIGYKLRRDGNVWRVWNFVDRCYIDVAGETRTETLARLAEYLELA